MVRPHGKDGESGFHVGLTCFQTVWTLSWKFRLLVLPLVFSNVCKLSSTLFSLCAEAGIMIYTFPCSRRKERPTCIMPASFRVQISLTPATLDSAPQRPECYDKSLLQTAPFVLELHGAECGWHELCYVFGLKGPSMTIDTACSSSISALHAAVRSLEGEVPAALVAAAEVLHGPSSFMLRSVAGMLSPDGRCKTFDATADGYVRGEAGALLLKGRDEVSVGRCREVAQVRAVVMNQDGRSATLTAPNGPCLSQEELLNSAMQQADLEPVELGAIECHGTGTALGDPIEVGAIKAATEPFLLLSCTRRHSGDSVGCDDCGSLASDHDNTFFEFLLYFLGLATHDNLTTKHGQLLLFSSARTTLCCVPVPAAIGVRALQPGRDPDLLPDPPQDLRDGPDRDLLPSWLDSRPVSTMANPNSQGGVPLDEWRKDTPPGWRPGIENYPLKTYFAKLKLWYRCSEAPDEIIGPQVAGRLQGRAQRIALELKLIRPDGTYDVGDAALVRLSVDEVIDPNDGVTII
eukprot:s8027_g2.t1